MLNVPTMLILYDMNITSQPYIIFNVFFKDSSLDM